MKITSTHLAWICVFILVLYPVSATLAWNILELENYGLLAALLAADAGTAFVVGVVFNAPKFRPFAPRVLRVGVVSIMAISALLSGMYWLADEVDHLLLRAVIVAPVLTVLVILMLFVDKSNKERATGEDE